LRLTSSQNHSDKPLAVVKQLNKIMGEVFIIYSNSDFVLLMSMYILYLLWPI